MDSKDEETSSRSGKGMASSAGVLDFSTVKDFPVHRLLQEIENWNEIIGDGGREGLGAASVSNAEFFTCSSDTIVVVNINPSRNAVAIYGVKPKELT
ncbi:hypothetical protein L2E82_48435 [Cichorium intybus]|uniref:Uncharacterized protein n=1 Tax=Cichorium intybus TaxID=13427 RepID=A0ACB8YY59_CICIN|nr:hypothetical protein L2E82_48435 [Cichorium intybus]